MGIDCCITFPPATRVRDVATVIARLTGAPMRLETTPVLAAHVDGLRLESAGLPECVRISWWDGVQNARSALYHFEWGSHPGCHGMMLPASAENLALGQALVDFFGGEVDYHDGDDCMCDYSQPAQTDIHASDGDAWNQFQRRLFAVQPLSQDDIAVMQAYAAY